MITQEEQRELDSLKADSAAEAEESAQVQGPTYQTSTGEALLEAGKQGATLGFSDELGAAIATGGFSGPEYEAARDIAREKQRLTSEEHPFASMGVEIATAAIPGGAIIRGLRGAARAAGSLSKPFVASGATGSALGGGYGAGLSEAKTPRGIALDALEGAAIGGAFGPATEGGTALLGAAGRGVGGVIERAAKSIQAPTVADLMDTAISRGVSSNVAFKQALAHTGREKGFLESATGGIRDISGKVAEDTGKGIKHIGEKISRLPERWRSQFSGKTGGIKDAQTDFVRQSADKEYREASRNVTNEAPGRYSEALSRLETGASPNNSTGLPANTPVPSAIRPDVPDAPQALEPAPVSNSGLPPGTPWDSPHADVYATAPLTRSRALELMASEGKYSSDQGLSRYLSSVGRPQAESMRQPFDVTFARRTKGKKGEAIGDPREMTAHLGINKYVTGEGMAYDPVKKDLINIWESKNVTPEALYEFQASGTPGRMAQRALSGKHPGEAGYRMINVEGISQIRPGSKKGMVTHRFTPRVR